MSQQQANMLRALASRFVHTLRAHLGASGDANATKMVDALDGDVVDRVHDVICDATGITAKESNRRGHPWDRKSQVKSRAK